MNATKVSNVEFDTSTSGVTTQPNNKPPARGSSRPNSSTSVTKQRSNSASSVRPVLHQPCSSTLGKFHDAVNFSLLNDSSSSASPLSTRAMPPQITHRSNTPRSNHPVLEAKQKYKYMAKQKSFVDESLFGGNTTSRSGNVNDAYQFSRTHVTHDLMSNLAPLQIHAGRPSTARRTQRDDDDNQDESQSRAQQLGQNENRPLSSTYKISAKPPTPKPWRP